MEILKYGKELVAIHDCKYCEAKLRIHLNDGYVKITRIGGTVLRFTCDCCDQWQEHELDDFKETEDN